MKKIATKLFMALSIIFCTSAAAQKNDTLAKTKKWFVGYETLEMSMNKFKYFAGEIGYRINPRHQIRLVIGEIKLTESHLASSWQARAVDGDNVEGYFRIYELNYDYFIGKRRNWYYGANIAYVNDQYEHMISDKKIDNHTFTIGLHAGYQFMDLFGIKHLYINASLPFRFYFNQIPEQKWGETTVQKHALVDNIWLFVGYRF